MLYKGARLLPDQIDNWERGVILDQEDQLPLIQLPPFTSYTNSVNFALDCALANTHMNTMPVIFCMSNANYNSFGGFSMANQAYSAYPTEQEVVLNQGTEAYVLSVEREVPFVSKIS